MALLWRRHKRRKVRRGDERSTLRHVLWGIVIFLCFAALVYGAWYLTRLPSLTIQEVVVMGGETVPHEELRALAERELTGSYFLLVPHRFIFMYPKEQIHDALSAAPRVHNVAVSRVDTRLEVSFDEYIPEALLCESGFETAQCYFLDESGYAFSPAPQLRGGAFVRHVIEGETIEPGIQAFESHFLQAQEDLINAFESEFGFRVRLITHTEVGDITYHLSGGGRLFAARDMSTQETFENLQSVLVSEAFQHLEPGSFNYIDLRFGNKIFVNEELELVATTTEATSTDPSFVIE